MPDDNATFELEQAAALDHEAHKLGFASWRDVLLARKAWCINRGASMAASLANFVIDPVLPKAFDSTPNEDRSTQDIVHWWDKPYAVTRPDGLLEVRCLHGGAWDRSSYMGTAENVGDAILLAKTVLAEWLEVRARPMLSLEADDCVSLVLPPQFPFDAPRVMQRFSSLAQARAYLDAGAV